MKRLLAVLLLVGSSAFADIPGIYNTGVNAIGGVDQQWTVSGQGYTTAYVLTDLPSAWLGDSSTSNWIGPVADAGAGAPPQTGNETCAPNCNYIYQTTFDISSIGLNPSLTLQWAADNALLNVQVNGQNNFTGLNGTDYSDATTFENFSTFTVTGLKVGVNTLDFVVNNFGYPGPNPPQGWGGANPTGLNVQFLSSSEITVPEPSTLLLLPLMLFGLLVAGCFSRKVTA